MRKEDQEEVVQVVTETEEGQVVEEIEIDPMLLERYMNKLRAEQNLAGGILGGLFAAVLGAAIWAGITYASDTKFGLVALLIGAMTGYAVRIMGKGIDPIYRAIGALSALVGCAFGNVLMFAVILQKTKGIPIEALLLNTKFIVLVFKKSSPFDLLFYGIAVYEGYQFAPREIDPDDLLRNTRRQ